ncbi:copper amine oxidase N-terminal domain-containing protein [Paenibacillus sp. MER TA 81-3]|uniref:copper amine oxidase N-terminal domain-containing protein n=1 Tax=Paenibacillus sp. MER TA 81-3 TaxID=2939573 RepID=UPI00204011EC|nr:copper amine oxidase N-terminal domain-containing protein [Paenibacillus sp. MER TA 81-3]MCM3342506.1 copper amine oxidase N-terminal domain-containing protein [Paenibacillus sp. MER TA 81-3]
MWNKKINRTFASCCTIQTRWSSEKTEIAPLLLQGTVYVPLETLTAHLGVKAEWIAENRVVNLSLPTVLLKPDKHTNDADVHDMLQLLNEYVKQYNAHNEPSSRYLIMRPNGLAALRIVHSRLRRFGIRP